MVYSYDANKKVISEANVFDHYRFKEEVCKLLEACEKKEEFAEELRRPLFYYFGCKCEYEVVISSFPPHITKEELDKLNMEYERSKGTYGCEPRCLCVNPDVASKVDIRSQILLNYNIFVDYIWSYKGCEE